MCLIIDAYCIDEDIDDTFVGVCHSVQIFFDPKGEDINDILFGGKCTYNGGGCILFVFIKLRQLHCYMLNSVFLPSWSLY